MEGIIPGDEELFPPEGNDGVQQVEEQFINLEITEAQEEDHEVPPERNDGVQQVDQEQPINLEITDEGQQEDLQVPPDSENTTSTSTDQAKKSHTLRELMDLEYGKLPINVDNEETHKLPISIYVDEVTRNGFGLLQLIGTASGGAVEVYRAAYVVHDWQELETMSIEDLFVTIKSIREDQESELALNDLKRRVEKSELVADHPNIMGIKNTFTYEGKYYVVFPLMELGSLRFIMNKKFPHGMPEECVVVAIREALKGLSVIHLHGFVHQEISAGNIFLSGGQSEIKIAFSGSVYDHGLDQNRPSSSTPYLPMASIFNWAGAPELLHGPVSNVYTPKADIWLIGITALELAYGKINVLERRDFDSLMETLITKGKNLPLRLQEESDDQKGNSSSSPKGNLSPRCINLTRQFKRRAFTRDFGKMVLKCLAMDPDKRPSADELLECKIFRKTLKLGATYFRDCVRS